jgi:hypothetical protein
LGSEVTAFEFTHRALQTVRATHASPLPNLWSWNGQGGWKQALINDALTFGLLKGAGYFSRESNVVFQHAFSSTALVAGHQLSAQLGFLPNPVGSLAEQLLHAEATNLQLNAGTSLVQAMAPGISALERGLDLSLQTRGRAIRRSPLGRGPQWATINLSIENQQPPVDKTELHRGPSIMQMSTPGEDFLTRRSHVTIPFEQGALAIGGRDALNWLLMIREAVEKKEAPEGFADAPYLWWVPETPEQTYLLNEFGLVFREDQKDFEPINPEGKIKIRAFMPLLKLGEVFIIPEDFGESLKKILDKWSKRETIKLMGKSETEWLGKNSKACGEKVGVIRIDEGPSNRFLIFKNKRRQPILPISVFSPST